MIDPRSGAQGYPRFVSLLERDIGELQQAYPMLTLAEVRLVIEERGPDRTLVERELARLSASKS